VVEDLKVVGRPAGITGGERIIQKLSHISFFHGIAVEQELCLLWHIQISNPRACLIV
jgi:hypothetical protein